MSETAAFAASSPDLKASKSESVSVSQESATGSVPRRAHSSR